MSKDKKFPDINLKTVIRTMIIIALIAVLTYATMAVITHFSLNFKLETYKFRDSLLSIFDFETAIFKFFLGFMILNIIWLSLALLIWLIKKIIFNN
jgi:hypothetical protein